MSSQVAGEIIASRAAVVIRGVLWPAAQSPHAKKGA